MKRTVALIILDGFGIRESAVANAVKGAKKPNLDRIFAENPLTAIEASGLAVGLPDGQMGNSEVGHLNIGAGRIVYQDLTRIDKAIEEGSFFKNAALLSAVRHAKEKGTKLHLMGLFSDGGVHSHIRHLKALVELAKKEGLSDVYIHAFTDGRDTSPTSGARYLEDFEKYLKKIGVGEVASVTGRYYAMDRDKRWNRTEMAYRALTGTAMGEGAKTEGAETSDGEAFKVGLFKSAAEIFKKSYAEDVTDEFILPSCVASPENPERPLAPVEDGDAIIFFNFRPDRARQITRAFVDEHFEGFDRDRLNLKYICMTEYDAEIKGVEIAYEPETLVNTLGEYVSKLGIKQLRIAETEKYAHVTFFFGGGVEKPYEGEERVLVPSPKVATYDLQPEMSAPEVARRLVEQIESDKFGLIICNFANPDMVGHTGNYDAAVKAIEAVDECIGKVAKALDDVGAGYIITADHGNSECMANDDGSPMTAHTTNLVPLVVCGMHGIRLREGGKLSDIAPTLLQMLGLEKPAEMTGVSLIAKQNKPILSCGIETPDI